MKAAEDVRSPVVTVFLPLIKKLRFRDTETVKKELQLFYRQ